MHDGNESAAGDTRLAMATEAIRKAEGRAVSGLLALEMLHEIKNPLEALGHLTWLTLEQADDPACVRKYMLEAREQMALLRSVASETLGFARTLQAPVATRGLTLAQAALRLHQRTADAKGIHLVTEVPPEITAEVHPSELLQVLSNLIANALDALTQGGTLQLRVHRSGGRIHFLVADNGAGIPPEHRRHLFEPFFSTKEAAGNGLGLALSKKLVERHGGTITFRSSVHPARHGTIFRVSVPAGAPSGS